MPNHRPIRFPWPLLLLALLIPVPSVAAEPNPPGDPDVYILVSSSPEFFEEEEGEDGAPSFDPLREVSPGQTAHVLFLVTGLTEESGSLDYAVSWRLLDPGGNELAVQRDYATGRQEAPGRPAFVVAEPALELRFEDTDPRGTYTLEAMVEDRGSGKRAQRAYRIELAE